MRNFSVWPMVKFRILRIPGEPIFKRSPLHHGDCMHNWSPNTATLLNTWYRVTAVSCGITWTTEVQTQQLSSIRDTFYLLKAYSHPANRTGSPQGHEWHSHCSVMWDYMNNWSPNPATQLNTWHTIITAWVSSYGITYTTEVQTQQLSWMHGTL